MGRTRTIIVTLGDPLGIGPEVALKAIVQTPPRNGTEYLIIGPERAWKVWPESDIISRRDDVRFIATEPSPRVWTPMSAGRSAAANIEAAVAILKRGEGTALVTAPISKERAMRAGFGFAGHTDFLAHAFGVRRHAMMLFHENLRVTLTTIHVALREVVPLVTRRAVREKLELTADALRRLFAIRKPRLAVCGLNPHAGENGRLGDEEKRVILPAIRDFRRSSEGTEVSGPFPADTLFRRAIAGEFDAVLCHYHDQGLIPLKTTGFARSVNMTLGLPFLRLSPDHGTADDIAGKGIADPASILRALQAASGELIRARPGRGLPGLFSGRWSRRRRYGKSPR